MQIIDRQKMRERLLRPLLEKAEQFSKRFVKKPDLFFEPKWLEAWTVKQVQESYTLYIHLKSFNISMDDLGLYLRAHQAVQQSVSEKPARIHTSAEVVSARTREDKLIARRKESRNKRLRGKR